MSNNHLAQRLSSEYADYFLLQTDDVKGELNTALDSSFKQINKLSALTLEISKENSAAFEQDLPHLFDTCQELHRTFQCIDHLENLVNAMKEDVATFEETVTKAEKDLGTIPKISNVIKPLLQKKERDILSCDLSCKVDPTFKNPEISVDLSKYFPVKSPAA